MCPGIGANVSYKNLPGDPYSCLGSLQILGITSIKVFTYCRIVPCNYNNTDD